ncbi:hypothetical protein DL96DRAFT_1597740, partial [Flagelloscypha sp. PMI_526]
MASSVLLGLAVLIAENAFAGPISSHLASEVVLSFSSLPSRELTTPLVVSTSSGFVTPSTTESPLPNSLAPISSPLARSLMPTYASALTVDGTITLPPLPISSIKPSKMHSNSRDLLQNAVSTLHPVEKDIPIESLISTRPLWTPVPSFKFVSSSTYAAPLSPSSVSLFSSQAIPSFQSAFTFTASLLPSPSSELAGFPQDEVVAVSSNPHSDLSAARTLGLVCGLFVVLTLGAYFILKVLSTRRKTQDAKAARIWEYLTPSPRTKALATVQCKGISNLDMNFMGSDSEKGFAPLVENQADLGPDASKPIPRHKSIRHSIPLVQWLKFPPLSSSPVPTLKSPPRIYQPQARHGRSRIMNITREIPESRFSVSSSDYEDDGCVADRRVSHLGGNLDDRRPCSASSWGSAVSGEEMRPYSHTSRKSTLPIPVIGVCSASVDMTRRSSEPRLSLQDRQSWPEGGQEVI